MSEDHSFSAATNEFRAGLDRQIDEMLSEESQRKIQASSLESLDRKLKRMRLGLNVLFGTTLGLNVASIPFTIHYKNYPATAMAAVGVYLSCYMLKDIHRRYKEVFSEKVL